MITLPIHVFMFTIPFGTRIGILSENIIFGSRLLTLVGVDLIRQPQNLWPLNFEKFQNQKTKFQHFRRYNNDVYCSFVVSIKKFEFK